MTDGRSAGEPGGRQRGIESETDFGSGRAACVKTSRRRASPQWLNAHRKTSKLPRDKVYAAHVLHARGGVSIRELGRRLAPVYGYRSADACAQALMRAFRFYGLSARNRVEATVAAHLTHGRARRKGQPGSDLAAYVRWRRTTSKEAA